MASYDIVGSIAIIKPEGKSKKQKLQLVRKLLNQSNIKTVLEKVTEVKGRLRTFKTKYIAGEKTKETIHKENNCLFKLNVETCYFSPRLNNERKQIALKIKKKDNVLVMFSGIGCYPIKIYELVKPKKITIIDISRECNKYARENLKLNKISEDHIRIIQGDVKRKMPNEKFNVIVMTRPNLKNTFLDQALKVSKKGTKIFYYGFCKDNELNNLKNQLINESGKLKRKIKIMKIIKAGDIAPYKFRYRIEINVL